LAEGEKTRNYGVLLLIDCNDFKQINDVHGHAMGDEALKMLGRTLRDCSQGDDVIGRLGGDEFVILLAESDMVGANQYLNRVNGVLARSGSGLPFTVSISAGSALQGVHGRTLDALMEQADAAMYRNKQRRKMAVVTEPSTNRTGLLS
jgi:diguanylate cyclase (GGDEF)-like protein